MSAMGIHVICGECGALPSEDITRLLEWEDRQDIACRCGHQLGVSVLWRWEELLIPVNTVGEVRCAFVRVLAEVEGACQ